jgi:hypothetical protein
VTVERPKQVVRRVLKGYRDGEGVSSGKGVYARSHEVDTDFERGVMRTAGDRDGNEEQQVRG